MGHSTSTRHSYSPLRARSRTGRKSTPACSRCTRYECALNFLVLTAHVLHLGRSLEQTRRRAASASWRTYQVGSTACITRNILCRSACWILFAMGSNWCGTTCKKAPFSLSCIRAGGVHQHPPTTTAPQHCLRSQFHRHSNVSAPTARRDRNCSSLGCDYRWHRDHCAME